MEDDVWINTCPFSNDGCDDSTTIIVKNNIGAAYLPAYNYNGIGQLDSAEGYQTKIEVSDGSSTQGVFVGDYVDPSNAIYLDSGWNLFAVWRFYERSDCEGAVYSCFQDLFGDNVDTVVVIKDYQGNIIFPQYGYANMQKFPIGQGLQAK